MKFNLFTFLVAALSMAGGGRMRFANSTIAAASDEAKERCTIDERRGKLMRPSDCIHLVTFDGNTVINIKDHAYYKNDRYREPSTVAKQQEQPPANFIRQINNPNIS